MPDTYDCLIVGGGPAGLTAAIYLARYRRKVLVIDSGQSRAAWIPKSHNYPGFEDGISGKALLKKLREQAEEYDARGSGEQTIVVELLIGAPENILPARPGNAERAARAATAAMLGEFARKVAALRRRRAAGFGRGGIDGVGVKGPEVALRREEHEGGGCNQDQIIRMVGAGAGHQIPACRACCRRRIAA